MIRNIENNNPIVEISIIGTNEYLRKDCIEIYFLIIFLLNSFSDSNLILKYNTPKITNPSSIICQM